MRAIASPSDGTEQGAAGRPRVAMCLSACGLAAPLLWASAVIFSGSRHPEYSHIRQYISDLAARGSSTEHVMQAAGFILPGAMTAGFGIMLGLVVADRTAGVAAALIIVSGLARAAAGVFVPDPLSYTGPPSFEQTMHDGAGTVYILTLTLAVLVWAIASAFSRRRPSWLTWYSAVTATLAVAAPFALMSAGVASPGDVGLFQRVSLGILNAWMLVCASLMLARQ
jgi:hypothetical membrane protein